MIYTQHLKYLFYIHFIKIRKKCYYFYYDVLIDVFFKITKSCLLMQIVHSSASLYHQKCWILSIYLRGFFDQSASILDHIPFLTLSWPQRLESLIRIVYLLITIFSRTKKSQKIVHRTKNTKWILIFLIWKCVNFRPQLSSNFQFSIWKCDISKWDKIKVVQNNNTKNVKCSTKLKVFFSSFILFSKKSLNISL